MQPDAVIPAPARVPTCPHCKAELVGMGFYNWVNPPWIVLCNYCPYCGAALSFTPVPMTPEDVQAFQEAQSPIARPH